ncbi:hypothetical protein L209DRAFT_749185 [Thermothelomyces heterothallicus CBS 203.75]
MSDGPSLRCAVCLPMPCPEAGTGQARGAASVGHHHHQWYGVRIKYTYQVYVLTPTN